MAENNNDVNAGDEHGSATPSDNLKAESGSSGRKGETAPTKVGPADQPAGVLSSDEAKAAAIEAAKQRVAAAKAQSPEAGASPPAPPRPPVKKKEEGPL